VGNIWNKLGLGSLLRIGGKMLLKCYAHGRRIHRQTDPKGTERDEYVFVTPTWQVGLEDCQKCKDKRCPYNFNIPRLTKKKELRDKVLKSVYDPSLNDELLANGIWVESQPIYLRAFKGPVYSKPCFNRETGGLLEKLDREETTATKKYHQALQKATPLPRRVIIKRKR